MAAAFAAPGPPPPPPPPRARPLTCRTRAPPRGPPPPPPSHTRAPALRAAPPRGWPTRAVRRRCGGGVGGAGGGGAEAAAAGVDVQVEGGEAGAPRGDRALEDVAREPWLLRAPPPSCPVPGRGGEAVVGDLLRRIGYLGPVSGNKVLRALELARGHGVPLLVAQNVAVAAVVADMQMDVHTVCAAVLRGLLHDADEVTREVGGEAAAILAAHREVALVAACAAPRRAAPADYRALREMVLEAAAGDARAVALQLAAAAVSTRALGALPAGARERAARRAMALYAPLANRLGVYFLQSELEELAFMQLQPAAFRALSAELARLTRGSAAVLAENKAALDRALSGTPAVRGAVRSIAVRGRIKGVYSCYRKTLRTGKPLDQLHDLIALRVIVRARSADEPAQAAACFAVADAVRSHFHVIPARAKDYVTYPKPNGYRSLHLTVAHPGGTPGAWTPLEIQIRTEMMHRVAEFGSAAHWLYKHKEPWAGDTDLGLTGLATDLGELRM